MIGKFIQWEMYQRAAGNEKPLMSAQEYADGKMAFEKQLYMHLAARINILKEFFSDVQMIDSQQNEDQYIKAFYNIAKKYANIILCIDQKQTESTTQVKMLYRPLIIDDLMRLSHAFFNDTPSDNRTLASSLKQLLSNESSENPMNRIHIIVPDLRLGKDENGHPASGSIHGECAIAAYIAEKVVKKKSSFEEDDIINIGVNKLCCEDCKKYIDLINQDLSDNDSQMTLLVTGTSGYAFPRWIAPQYETIVTPTLRRTQPEQSIGSSLAKSPATRRKSFYSNNTKQSGINF